MPNKRFSILGFRGSSSTSKTDSFDDATSPSVGQSWSAYRSTLRMKKCWNQFLNQSSKTERQKILDQVVSLFNRVCPNEISEEFNSIFGDGRSFVYNVGSRFRKFLSTAVILTPSSSTESSESYSIGRLIQLFFSDEHDNFLECLNCLSTLSQYNTLVVFLCEAQLPSTMVNVFEHLLSLEEDQYLQYKDTSNPDPASTIHNILEKMKNILTQICQYKSVVSYMRKSDDISTIVRIIMLQGAPGENFHIRKGIFKALTEILKFTDSSLVDYLDEKKSVPLLLNRIRYSKNQPKGIILMMNTLKYILENSIPIKYKLYRNFCELNGQNIFRDVILSYYEIGIEYNELTKMLDILTDFVFIGQLDLLPTEEELKEGDLDITQLVNTRERRVRDISSYQALSNIFLNANTDQLRREVLDRLFFIFSCNLLNYPIVAHTHSVAVFITNIEDLSDEIQDYVLKLVEYIVTGINFKPFQEILSMVQLLQADKPYRLQYKVFNTAHKLIKFDEKYRDVFREAGTIEVLVNLVQAFNAISPQTPTSSDDERSEFGFLFSHLIPMLVDVLSSLLENAPKNVAVFRQNHGPEVMRISLTHQHLRREALRVFLRLVTQDVDNNENDVSCLIEALQKSSSDHFQLEFEICSMLQRMFSLNGYVKDAFRRDNGFPALIGLTVKVNVAESADRKFLCAALDVIGQALHSSPKNQEFFEEIEGYSSLLESFRHIGLLAEYKTMCIQQLLDLATERNLLEYKREVKLGDFILPVGCSIAQPGALQLLINIMKEESLLFTPAIFDSLVFIAKQNYSNLGALSSISLVKFILTQQSLRSALFDTDSPLNKSLMALLTLVGSFRLSNEEWRLLFNLLKPPMENSEFLDIFVKIAKHGDTTPFVRLDANSLVRIPHIGDRSWPPSAGYSFSMWISFSIMEPWMVNKTFSLLELASDNGKHFLQLGLSQMGEILIQTGHKNRPIAFPDLRLTQGRWYHVVFVHQRVRFSQSNAYIYIDGLRESMVKLPWLSSVNGNKVTGRIGLLNGSGPIANTWSLGPMLLYEDVLSPHSIASMFVAGPNYCGSFQGRVISRMSMNNDILYPSYIRLLQRVKESPSGESDQLLTVDPVVLPSEKIIFSFNASQFRILQLNRIRNSDNASVKYERCLVNIMDNISNNLPYGILLGRSELCHPRSFAEDALNVDGLKVVFAWIENASTEAEFFSSLSIFKNLLMDSPKILHEVERLSGYQVVSEFLKNKTHLIGTAIIDLLWQIALTGSERGKEIVTNLGAMRYIMLNFDIWRLVDVSLQVELLRRLYLIISYSSFASFNIFRLRKTSIVPTLLTRLKDPVSAELVQEICRILGAILQHQFYTEDMQHISHFLVTSLDIHSPSSPDSSNHRSSFMSSILTRISGRSVSTAKPRRRFSAQRHVTIPSAVPTRNLLLKSLLDLISKGKNTQENIDTMLKVIDYRWFFHFFNGYQHPITAILGLQLLTTLLLARTTFAHKWRQHEGFSMLRRCLTPYCNQNELFLCLFCLILGIYPTNISYEENPEFVSLLSTAMEDAPVVFPEVLSIVLRLLKICADPSSPVFDRQSTPVYFRDFVKIEAHRPNKARDRKSKKMRTSFSRKSRMGSFHASESPELSSLSSTTTLGEESEVSVTEEDPEHTMLSNSIVSFLTVLLQQSSEFREECRRSDNVEDTVDVLFSHSLVISLSGESETSQSNNTAEENNLLIDDLDAELGIQSEVSSNSCETVQLFENTTSALILQFIYKLFEYSFVESSKAFSTLEDFFDLVPDVQQEHVELYRIYLMQNLIRLLLRMETKEFVENNKLSQTTNKLFALLVDRASIGSLPGIEKEIVNFFSSMLSHFDTLEETTSRTMALFSNNLRILDSLVSGLFKAANRMVLFLVWQADDAAYTDELRFEVLSSLLEWVSMLCHPKNNDEEFFAIIFYILYKYLDKPSEELQQRVLQLFKLLISVKSSKLSPILIYKYKSETIDLTVGFDKLLEKDSSFLSWFHENREIIETHFGSSVRRLCTKYQERENSIASSLKTSIENKIQKRHTEKTKRESNLDSVFTELMQICSQYLKESQEEDMERIKMRLEKEKAQNNFILDTWKNMRRGLFFERAVWGHDVDPAPRWCLDFTEGPSRTRRRLRRWTEDTEHYQPMYTSDQEESPSKDKLQQKENNQQNNEESKNTKISNENQTEDSYEEQDIPQLMVSGPEEMGDEKENHTQDNEEEKDQIESEHKPQQNRNKPIPNLTVGVDSPMSLSFGRQFQQFDGLTRSPISSSRLKSFDTPSSTPRKLNFGEESAKNQIRKETEDIETASSSSESSDEGDKSEHNNTEKETLENEFDQVQYPSEDEEAEDDSSIDSGYTAEDVGSRSYAEMIYDNDQFHKIRKLIDPDERILNIYNCLRVTGLDANTSIFVMCRKAVYVISNYQLRENTLVEVSDSSYGAWDIQQRTTSHTSKNSLGTQSSSSPSNSSPKNSGDGVDQKEEQTEEVQQHKIQKILYEDITELHKRRYLLRPVALELFCSNGKNVFLVFYIDEREEAYRQLIRDMPTKHLFGSRITGGGKEGYSSLKSWRKAMTSRWQKGEVSNFEYLMFINTIAGRSYNDLTQYPVFPWVLADYSSEELDLSDPNSFRDLSKPMGALGKRRREEFLERFESWEDPLSNVPAFHYGTHYSSAAIVLYYLIRLEPFTKQSMQLQGGRFDHADRLFFSMEETWRSAAEQNMSDVKELIPEFYYLPEFLENSNRLSMGVKQTGQAVDDVVLPPWAHGDPHIFIRKHRQALESPYVSENLHHWIDLIFGYKQKGQAAIDAMNVFYYLTYEGAVDIDEIENQMEREAVITQINNFGQTPHQVFKHQHPQRNVSTPSPLPTIYTFPEKLVSEPSRPNNTKNVSLRGVYQLRFKSDHAMALGQHSVFVEPSGHKYLQWGYPDNTLRLFQTSNHQLLSVYENTHESNITEAAVAPTGKELVIGGQDGTLSVWNLNKTPRSRSLTLRKRLFVHLRAITCIIISAAHSIIVSSSEDGLCVIWDLNSLQYVRQLQHQSIGPVSCSAVNAHSGDIVTAAGSAFFIWNINGTLLASHDTHKGSITALNLTAGPEWLNSTTIVTGHSDGAVKCWYFQPVQPHGDRISLRKEYTEHIQAVRSIAIHPNQKRMVTGDDSSTVLLRHLPFEGTQSHWIRDDEVDKCMQCESPFNQLRRRHHCRSCGRVVCGSCSSQKTELPVYNFFRPVRVCSDCYELASALRSQGTMY